MRFLVDAMFPPAVVKLLHADGHDAVSPSDVGAHNLTDEVLIDIATREERVIVTENARHFAGVTTCPVLFVLKNWWPRERLAPGLAAALGRWSMANPEPGNWPDWLDFEYR